MAIGRLSMKLGKRGKGRPHADYIMRQGEYAMKHEQFEKLEAIVDGNMPTWAAGDPRSFFEASDANERANAKYSYREMELSLPRELTPEQRLELVNDWCRQELPNYPFLYAIHNPRAIDGGDQPHAHLMFSERENDGIERDEAQFFKRANRKHPERGGARKTYNLEGSQAERRDRLKALRQRWQEHLNEYLLRVGIDARIDMRSYVDQGIDKVPTPKMTPRQSADRKRLMAEANTYKATADAMLADMQSKASEYIAEKSQEARLAAIEREKAEQARLEAIEREKAEQARLEAIEREAAEKACQQALERESAEPAFDAEKLAMEMVKMETDEERYFVMFNAAKWDIEDFDALEIAIESLMDGSSGKLTAKGKALRAELLPPKASSVEGVARTQDEHDWEPRSGPGGPGF